MFSTVRLHVDCDGSRGRHVDGAQLCPFLVQAHLRLTIFLLFPVIPNQLLTKAVVSLIWRVKQSLQDLAKVCYFGQK